MRKGNGHITAFYLETLLMILVFVGVILVLTQFFGVARLQSAEAQSRTSAVALSESVVSAAQASTSAEELAANMADGKGRVLKDGDVPVVEAVYDEDLAPAKSGPYTVRATWEETKGHRGSYVTCDIEVYVKGQSEPVFADTTGVYAKEVP